MPLTHAYMWIFTYIHAVTLFKIVICENPLTMAKLRRIPIINLSNHSTPRL